MRRSVGVSQVIIMIHYVIVFGILSSLPLILPITWQLVYKNKFFFFFSFSLPTFQLTSLTQLITKETTTARNTKSLSVALSLSGSTLW